MIRYIIILSLAFMPLARAGMFLSATGVVESAVSASQTNKLSEFLRCCDLPAIASATAGPVQPEDVMKILRDVDLKKSTVKLVSEEKESALVRVVGQGAKIDLTLSKKEKINGTLYQIVAMLVRKE